MARLEVNRSGELEVFVRVIELGSFSAAARECAMTPSAVSKLVARLEQRLGTRLVNRSTRHFQLTPEGCTFYKRGVRILADLEEAERCAGLHSAPRGRLRVSANIPFGRQFLIPLIPAFLEKYPDVTIDILLTDEIIDLLEQRIDISILIGTLKSSGLMARKLGETRMIVVGSPAYLTRYGTPVTPEDLSQHNLLESSDLRAHQGWPFEHKTGLINMPVIGNAHTSDGDALHRLTLAGLGLARLPACQVHKDIESGRLVSVLEPFNPQDAEEVHAVFVGQGGYLPARVRALLDFLAEKVKI